MDPLDRLGLNEGMRAFGAAQVVAADTYFTSPHPIDELIALAAASLPKPLLFGVSEKGRSAHFFLTGLAFLPVIFSARYVGIVGKLLRLRGDLFDLNGLRRQATEVLALETIAEFCLLDGRIDWPAALFFMKSRLAAGNLILADARSFLGAGTDMWAIEESPVDEYYVSALMFGLAHEIGHAIEQSRPEGLRGPPWCSDDQILEYRESVAATFEDLAGLGYRAAGPSAVLDINRLRSEAAADIEGCRLIAKAAGPILAKYGVTQAAVNLESLFESLLINYLVLGFIEACRRTASMMSPETGTLERTVELLQQPIAFATRERVLQDHLPIIALEALNPGLDVPLRLFGSDANRNVQRLDPALRRACSDIWDSAVARNKGFYAEIDQGLVAAMSISENDDSQMQQLVVDYAAIASRGETDGALDYFIGLASSLGVSESRWKALANALIY